MKWRFILGLLLALPVLGQVATTPQPDVWRDPDTGAVIVVAKAPRAGDGQAIRGQIAGVLESLLAQPILPVEFGQITVNELPAFYARGVLLAEPEEKGILALVVFSAKETAVATVVTRSDPDFSYGASEKVDGDAELFLMEGVAI